jgi:hypothetical protein
MLRTALPPRALMVLCRTPPPLVSRSPPPLPLPRTPATKPTPLPTKMLPRTSLLLGRTSPPSLALSTLPPQPAGRFSSPLTAPASVMSLPVSKMSPLPPKAAPPTRVRSPPRTALVRLLTLLPRTTLPPRALWELVQTLSPLLEPTPLFGPGSSAPRVAAPRVSPAHCPGPGRSRLPPLSALVRARARCDAVSSVPGLVASSPPSRLPTRAELLHPPPPAVVLRPSCAEAQASPSAPLAPPPFRGCY